MSDAAEQPITPIVSGANGRLSQRLLAVALLLLMFGLALNSMVVKSPTFDEQGFLVRGLGYIRGKNRHMRVGHPLGLNALNALLLRTDERVVLPTEDPSWALTSFHRPAELFLWELGNDVELIMFLARLPSIWLGLLLAALTGRWVAQLSRRSTLGLLGLAFIALDPNILAHTRLTTTDLGLTATATLAIYLLWRALRAPSWHTVALAGVGFGLLQNSKFTAGLLVPLMGLIILVALAQRWRHEGFPARLLAQFALLFPSVALLTLWASYGFQIGVLPDNGTMPQWAGLTLPLSHHLDQLLDIFARAETGASSFLLGNYSETGWWYYFPIVFLAKTPLPTLLLLLAGLIMAAVQLVQHGLDDSRLLAWAALLLPALGYFAIALLTTVNLGYRHLLPILPLLIVFALGNVSWPDWPVSPLKRFPAILTALAFILFVNTAFIAPDFLAFFNLLAGGPTNGWRVAVDSNIDWGQDLARLAEWQAENEQRELWLSYFGEARPDYYGLYYSGIPSFPPRLTNPAAIPFSPTDPAPGLYAISASNLQGVLFQNHDLLAWFRDKEPIEKIGYSIFIYEVAPTGPRVGLTVGGAQLTDLTSGELDPLATNNIRPGWFDPAYSLQWSNEEQNAVYLPADLAAISPFAPLLSPYASGQANLWQVNWGDNYGLTQDSVAGSGLSTFFRLENGLISLFNFSMAQSTISPEQELLLQTVWFQGGVSQPVKQFIHLRDSNNEIVSQWDGFGAQWEGWQRGDLLWQEHRLAIPADLPAGTYHLYTGLYQPDSFARWTVGNGDELLIQSFDFMIEEDPAP